MLIVIFMTAVFVVVWQVIARIAPRTVMVIAIVAKIVIMILKVMVPVEVIQVMTLIMRLGGSHMAQDINGSRSHNDGGHDSHVILIAIVIVSVIVIAVVVVDNEDDHCRGEHA